ncbi:hypothetical protein [Asticcacaulis benevestitus]|uniref:Uncharacterized protein n=1 Tax=Asticcacaulis benevestitus DSM 16100 = ATCC BAA-896 TaxID=1121022 RepID=V4Q473_9CAUL|nr:hypothetical protein [Asticcacaulis benevestitus]ESQ94519.1 hypothetical protein ABENE_00060 [Asticcacaulis benevestitus DSM 16100 = ATCC BAA-896]
MTQPLTPSHIPLPDRQRLRQRQRAAQLIAAFEATSQQTVTEINCAARALIVLDRMLTQLWTEPGDTPVRRAKNIAGSAPAKDDQTPDEKTSDEDTRSQDTGSEETGSAPPPLNRRQHRALAARTRITPQATPSSLRCESG